MMTGLSTLSDADEEISNVDCVKAFVGDIFNFCDDLSTSSSDSDTPEDHAKNAMFAEASADKGHQNSDSDTEF